jgi:methyl-accepting chemotaxis protein
MAQIHKRRTKNFFIKKNFQGKMVLAVFLAVIIGCLIFIVVFGLFSADTMTISYENNDLRMGSTPAMLLKNALAANWIFLVICGTLLVAAALIGTHRIAGPIFRFEQTLDSMTSKDLSKSIHLRDKDEGKDLALKINTFNSALSNEVRQLKRSSRAINDLLNQYSALKGPSLSKEDMDSICGAIKSNNRKIQNILDAYTLADD